MGYVVSTIASISVNDNHKYFLYFIPGESYREGGTKIANQYFESEFDNIASSIGPDGVIIRPHAGRAEEYIASISSIKINGCLFAHQDGFRRDPIERHFHNGQSYLIVTSNVIGSNKEEIDGFIVNLDSIPDKKTLGSMMGLLLSSIKIGNLSYFVKNFKHWDRAYDIKSIPDYTSMLELKPNLFGIGVNLNEIISHINKRFSNDHYSDSLEVLPRKESISKKVMKEVFKIFGRKK